MPRAWRRQAGAAQAAGVDVSTHTAGECGGARAVLTQRPRATSRASSGARGTRARAPTPELGVQQIFRCPRPYGQARGLGLAALAGIVDDRVRAGRGGNAVSVRADTALPQVWRRVKPGTFLGQDSHLLRRFATATATNIPRHTRTHKQINTQRRVLLSGRAGMLSHSRYATALRARVRAP